MNFMEKITGSDITRDMNKLDARAKKLPAGFLAAWEEIKSSIWLRAKGDGRSLIPYLDGALGLLEETASDGQTVSDALGGDIDGFVSALIGDEGAKTYRDKWRDQLNGNIAKKLQK